MIKMDNLHYDWRRLDGFNKDINIAISCREPGKSSMFMMTKSYRIFKKTGAPYLYLVRNVVEISEAMIETWSETIINKFTDDNVKLQYNKAQFKEGIVDVKINGKIFIRLLAMSIPLRRIKSSLLKDVAGIFLDEFIINPRKNEKYLKDEVGIFKEIYTTYKRERLTDKPLKFYMAGNPYSLYNPYFMWLGVDVNKLKLGHFYVGDNFVIDYYKMKDELREKLLKENPLLTFDEEFKSYALDGKAILDQNIKLGSLPVNYSLKFVVKNAGKYIGIFKNQYWEDGADKYFCKYVDKDLLAKNREAFCFEFGELVDRCVLISNQERTLFNHFKIAMRKRNVVFSDISVYYMIEEIYNYI